MGYKIIELVTKRIVNIKSCDKKTITPLFPMMVLQMQYLVLKMSIFPFWDRLN